MMRRLGPAIIAVLATLVFGTLGYVLIEGWPLLDAMYMTVITVGTVGFREVNPLSSGGMVFTMVLILAGVAALGFALAQLLDFLLEGHLLGMLEGRRMAKHIEGMNGHAIVAGMGRVGSVVARSLAEEGTEFVVVDSEDDAIAQAKEEGWAFVQGDATEESVLQEAGIERAGSLVTALSGDAENLFVTVTARSLNPDMFIVARSAHATSEAKLLKGGANRVLTPNVIGGRRMATMVLHPFVADYLDLVSHGDGVEFRLQEVELTPGSPLVDRSIADARVRETTGAYILAVTHADGRVDTNPSPNTVLHAGDRLVVLGTVTQCAALTKEA